MGLKQMYGSYEQLQELQRLVESTGCPQLAITWRVQFLPNRRSLLLWDTERQTLVRIHVEGSTASWELWTGATKAAILADDPDDGFDYASYRDGRGKVPLSDAAKAFVREQDAKTFAPAL